MNKLLVFPLFIMVMLTVVSFAHGMSTVMYTNDPIGTSGNITTNGSDTAFQIKELDLSIGMDLWGTGIMTAMIALVAVGIIAGIRVFGSGLSDSTQNFIMQGVGFIGLWGLLSVVTLPLLTGDGGLWGTIAYAMLSLMYGVGFLFQVSSGGVSSE